MKIVLVIKNGTHQTLAAGTGIIAEGATDAAADSALVGQSTRNIYEAVPGCPRDLGEVEAGSYVFDADGNDIAGLDFLTLVRPFEVRTNDGDQFIVIPHTGKSSGDDPAIKKLQPSHFFLLRHPEADPADDEMSELKIRPYIQPAPNLPVKIDIVPEFGDPSSGDFDDNPDAKIDSVLSALDTKLDAVIADIKAEQNKAAVNSGNDPSIMIITRGLVNAGDQNSDDIDKRLGEIERKISAALENAIKVTTLSFGNEIPACIDGTPACWSLNRSVSVYSR